MDRRRFLLTSLAGVLAAPLAAGAQQSGKVYRIGVLSSGCGASRDCSRVSSETPRAWLRGGQKHRDEWSLRGGQTRRLACSGPEFIGLMVDVIFTVKTSATQPPKQATATVPIVMIGVGDAVESASWRTSPVRVGTLPAWLSTTPW